MRSFKKLTKPIRIYIQNTPPIIQTPKSKSNEPIHYVNLGTNVGDLSLMVGGALAFSIGYFGSRAIRDR